MLIWRSARRCRSGVAGHEGSTVRSLTRTAYGQAVHSGDATFILPETEQVDRATAALRMLSDPTRFRILWCLLRGESSVACLADLVGASTTAVSQHLAKLRLAGLVTPRREGSFIYYQADDHVRQLVDDALAHARP